MDSLGQNDLSRLMDSLLKGSGSTVSLNRKLMEKAIDVSWVEAIENGIIYVDNVVRNPSISSPSSAPQRIRLSTARRLKSLPDVRLQKS